MAIIKSKIRNTMTQQRLNALPTIFIEREITKSVSIGEIIDEFKIWILIQRILPL